MSGWLTGGVQLYVGKTRSGKTTAADEDAEAASRLTGFPVVTIDLMRAMRWAHLPHAVDWQEVADAAFVKRVRPRVWSPQSEEERVDFWKLLLYWGGCHVLIDEVAMMSQSTYVEKSFVQAALGWGQGKLGPTTYHVTAQRIGYVHRNVWPALDRVHVFCPAPGRDAKIIEEELGIPRRANDEFEKGSEELERGERIVVDLGFGTDVPISRAGNGDAPPPPGAGHEEKRPEISDPPSQPTHI